MTAFIKEHRGQFGVEPARQFRSAAGVTQIMPGARNRFGHGCAGRIRIPTGAMRGQQPIFATALAKGGRLVPEVLEIPAPLAGMRKAIR